MATPRQIESARINGVKSHGPKTPEGKRRSARNALKHGLTAQATPLDPDSAAELEQMIADYTADIRPTTPQEALLARRMAVAAFRVRQAWAAETRLWTRALAEYESFPAQDGLALAATAISNELTQIMRHESHFDRQFHAALTRLIALRKDSANKKKLILQNEPDPPTPEKSILQNEPDSDAPKTVFLQNEPDPTNHELRATTHQRRSTPHTCAPRSHPRTPISLIPLPPPVVPCLPGHLS
jgi:hypothetical protein